MLLIWVVIILVFGVVVVGIVVVYWMYGIVLILRVVLVWVLVLIVVVCVDLYGDVFNEEVFMCFGV